MTRQLAVWAAMCLLAVGAAAWGEGEAAIETQAVYAGGAAPQHGASVWSMSREERAGGPGGRHLWLNGDWQARPWAGISFRRAAGEPWPLTPEWLANGFVRFLANGGLDRYGSPNGEIALQLRPECEGVGYERLQSRFVDRGRGLDEDPETWQEVLVPLRFWTALRPGMAVRGLSVQCVAQPTRSFGLAELALVRFAERPAWVVEAENRDVAQPWVKWPAYTDLPAALKADAHPPQVRAGRFVGPDGRRVFVLNPYIREDPRLDLWGRGERPAPPDHGLYDPKAHGWIYDELLDAQALCRLGFNSLSVTVPGKPFWDAVGYAGSGEHEDAGRLAETARRVGLPFYVDTVCWPWTLGKPASSPEKTALPAEAFTSGRHHWTPYRIIGPGREAWLKAWRLYAGRYHDAGARVLLFELLNEPAYVDLSPEHRREFAAWLRERHRTLEALNAAWGTRLASWEEAAAVDSDAKLKEVAGRFLDYDDYLSGRFAGLTAEGVAAVNALLPDALVGVQPMGGYALQPREAIWKHRLAAHESVVLTPTGGGRWSPGAGASRPPAALTESTMAGAPLENDLLLALAGTKMIVDNETYLRGQTARETRNRLWEHVVAGLDGLTIFSWSKRGWIWWKDRDALITEADKYPYSDLNPLARRTDALRGIHDFAAEVQPLADRILPKPWGPAPRVALLYSWPQARRWAVEPTARDKTAQYHAALRYSHWNCAIVPSDRALAADGLSGYEVVVAGGIRVAEPELPARLEAFVRGGGVLLVGEEPMAEDLYGRPLDTGKRLGVSFGAWLGAQQTTLEFPETPLAGALSGGVGRLPDLRDLKGTDGTVLLATADGRPVVVRHPLGRGLVYALGADLAGYPLAKVLAATLEDAVAARGAKAVPATWRAVEARTPDGRLAPNVLVSRRSYARHHAILLLNRDEYHKTVRLRVPGLSGTWRATEALSNKALVAADGWYELALGPSAPAVLLIQSE